MTSFCAICTSEENVTGTVEIDGRTYVACSKCLTEHPRSGRYRFAESGARGPNTCVPPRSKFAGNR